MHIFAQKSIDTTFKLAYNIITETHKWEFCEKYGLPPMGKRNDEGGVKNVALYIFLIAAGIAVMAVGHYEENKFVSIFARVIGDALFLLGFNFLLFWNQ